jgi:hypothetical protein
MKDRLRFRESLFVAGESVRLGVRGDPHFVPDTSAPHEVDMSAAGDYFDIGGELLIAEKGFAAGSVEHGCIKDAHLTEVTTNRRIVLVDAHRA